MIDYCHFLLLLFVSIAVNFIMQFLLTCSKVYNSFHEIFEKFRETALNISCTFLCYKKQKQKKDEEEGEEKERKKDCIHNTST